MWQLGNVIVEKFDNVLSKTSIPKKNQFVD